MLADLAPLKIERVKNFTSTISASNFKKKKYDEYVLLFGCEKNIFRIENCITYEIDMEF